ncbi:type II secretion system protein N [Alloalcanivorax venustensis]|uniref:type II secretion system protein N n=1 Tax=Alloalcanivorax venustensis TaxID=172371 RepID=UPI003517A0D3
MKSQKILTKCLLPLALFFLSLIFFLAKEKSGTDYAADPAKDNTDSFSDSMAPQSGGADAKASPVKTSPTSSRDTLSPPPAITAENLALLAVFEAQSPLASAVIHADGHGAHRYHLGAQLPEGGILTDIRSTEVIIQDGSRRITLRMALMGGAGRAEVADADEEEATSDNDGPKLPQRVLDFLKKLDLKPVSEHSPNGYRVGEDWPDSGTDELGIKPGDTIVAVNGYPVGEYHSDYLVWLSFKDRYRASVLVRTEEGDQFTFHFPDDVKGVSLPGTGG